MNWTLAQFLMTPEQMNELRCPDCSASVRLEPEIQQLACCGCARTYPIVAGIPRFVEQEHLASFGRQWNRYEVAHEDEDRATFEVKTGIVLSSLGRPARPRRRVRRRSLFENRGPFRACVIGVDHSTAVEKAAVLCQDFSNASFVQADLKRLPLESESFDAVFSNQIMHHDVDTRAVFQSVARMVKPGGRLAVWLYRKNQWWQEGLNSALRRRTVRMPPERLERWCRVGACWAEYRLVNRTLNKVVNFSSHPAWENRLCDTFDWYAPAYQHHHTVNELREWFRAAGFDDLKVLPPEKTGPFYRWTYERNLLIGSGVNVVGTRSESH